MAQRSGARSARGPVVLALRRARRLSLYDISAATGISVGYLSRIERGLHSASDGYTDRLADALQVPADVLAGHASPIGPLRQLLGVTDDDLAAAANMNVTRLARVERSSERPHPDELALIASRLGVDVDVLVSGPIEPAVAS